jgi:hypothetical protein
MPKPGPSRCGDILWTVERSDGKKVVSAKRPSVNPSFGLARRYRACLGPCRRCRIPCLGPRRAAARWIAGSTTPPHDDRRRDRRGGLVPGGERRGHEENDERHDGEAVGRCRPRLRRDDARSTWRSRCFATAATCRSGALPRRSSSLSNRRSPLCALPSAIPCRHQFHRRPSLCPGRRKTVTRCLDDDVLTRSRTRRLT